MKDLKNLRVVFMGTPSFASVILEKLIEITNVVMVVCQMDKEKTRKGDIVYSPVKKMALDNDILVFQPLKIKNEYEKIMEVSPDIIITAAYGQIIPSALLDFPKYGCINVHGSLLPKLRGGAPIHHALIDGYSKTGVTIMYMDKKMDSGDIISQEEVIIKENDTLDSLYYDLSVLGRDLLVSTLYSIINGTNKRIKQNENEVSFGYNITKEDEIINFNDTARNIFNKVRGLCSIPGAYSVIDNKKLKIYKIEITNILSKSIPGTIEVVTKNSMLVSTKDFLIKIIDVKLEGKKRCLINEFLNGIHDKDSYVGKVFSNGEKEF